MSNGDTWNFTGQAGAVGPNARSDNNTFNQFQEKQTLAEAADEIQQLLKQLEQTNPTATEIEKVDYVNNRIAPTLKQRIMGALKSGGETAFDELLDDPYIAVGKAIVKGWLSPE